MNTLYDTLIAPHTFNPATFLDCDDGSTISYASFVARTGQIAHVLHNAGVRAGDRIVVQAPKTADTIALYAAALQVGALYLPLNSAYTQSELRYFIDDAAPALVVCDAGDTAAMTALCSMPVLTIAADGNGTLQAKADVCRTTFDTAHRGPDDLAALLYTSGTTGRSKGAMMSHKNLLSNARALTDLWQITDRDRLIHALPIFHTHGLFVALNTCLLAGAQVRLMAAFDADTVMGTIPSATMLMGVPTFYTRLLTHPQLTRENCANMRLFISGSAPLLADTHRAFHDATGHHILERYGMTETNMITSNPYVGDRVPGTVGYALPDTQVIITQDGTPAATGDIGIIEVRGDNVFKGYWNMPDKTAQDLRSNGFFITGDLGQMDADGRISIVGRAKDLIIAGGYNIYPKEIEDAINAVPGVTESAVYGIPDPDFGETVVAAVVLDAGAAQDADMIAAAIGPHLARFKHPRRYVFMDNLPRNTMGKVQKNLLRDQT